MRHIAVVGSGPAGSYLAEQLLRRADDLQIDVLERLPTPLGLIRYGVAPDHQGTKAVSRLLDRALSRDRVRFAGNVEVGRDASLEELLAFYDSVILAVGAGLDRRLGIPGEGLRGVHGSGAFVGWYNCHPDRLAIELRAVRSVVVIGAGNVALDVVRVLGKSAEEFSGSDMSPDVEAVLTAQPLRRIDVVARGTAAQARFSPVELDQFAALRRVRIQAQLSAQEPGDNAVVATLRSLSEPGKAAPLHLGFRFGMTPEMILGEDLVEAVRFRDQDGALHDLAADLVVTCIGYEAQACSGLEPRNGVFVNDDGKVRDRLYAVGWCRHGPRGTIPTNRSEAQTMAQRIDAETLDGRRLGWTGLQGLLDSRGAEIVDYAGWRRIDDDEIARAGPQRTRLKRRSPADMISIARATG